MGPESLHLQNRHHHQSIRHWPQYPLGHLQVLDLHFQGFRDGLGWLVVEVGKMVVVVQMVSWDGHYQWPCGCLNVYEGH